METARGSPYSDCERPRHANASLHGRVLRKQRHSFLSIQLSSRHDATGSSQAISLVFMGQLTWDVCFLTTSPCCEMLSQTTPLHLARLFGS